MSGARVATYAQPSPCNERGRPRPRQSPGGWAIAGVSRRRGTFFRFLLHVPRLFGEAGRAQVPG
jgi:hypothetical protein